MREDIAVAITIFISISTFAGAAENTSSLSDQAQVNLTVGALLPIHGDYRQQGISAQIALKIAESDINKLFSDLGRPIRVHVSVRDTETDPDITLKALKELQSQGIRIIIGPEDSRSLSNVREYANASDIILISGSSTAPSLAIKNDTTFRLAPDDDNLARLLASVIDRDGIKVLIPLARKDLWAEDMLNFSKEEFESRGGKMLDAVYYDPDTSDFLPALDTLHSEVDREVKENGIESVAVYVTALDEIAGIFSRAVSDPLLSSVRWYGNDLSPAAISRDRKASKFALSTRFLCPAYGMWEGPQYTRIRDEVMNRTGLEASYFAVNDYDALWLIINTYLIVGSDDPKAFKWVLPMAARTYRSDSGWMKLNEAGDLEMVPYTLVYMQEVNETYRWKPYAIL